MKYALLLFMLFLSFNCFSGEWSIQFQNRETGDNPVFQVPKTDYFFPQRTNHEWQCLLKKEEIILNDQGFPVLGRVLACATKDGGFIGGTIACENLNFGINGDDASHMLMPEPCVDELELKELGPTVPNIKIVVKYEWWK